MVHGNLNADYYFIRTAKIMQVLQSLYHHMHVQGQFYHLSPQLCRHFPEPNPALVQYLISSYLQNSSLITTVCYCILTPEHHNLTNKNYQSNNMEDSNDDKWENDMICLDHLNSICFIMCTFSVLFIWSVDNSSLKIFKQIQ